MYPRVKVKTIKVRDTGGLGHPGWSYVNVIVPSQFVEIYEDYSTEVPELIEKMQKFTYHDTGAAEVTYTWYVPQGCEHVLVTAVGAGGGGGGARIGNPIFSGSGGNGGQSVRKKPLNVREGDIITITVGRGGEGGGAGNDGQRGNETVIGFPGASITLLGGCGGKVSDGLSVPTSQDCPQPIYGGGSKGGTGEPGQVGVGSQGNPRGGYGGYSKLGDGGYGGDGFMGHGNGGKGDFGGGGGGGAPSGNNGQGGGGGHGFVLFEW